METETIRRVMLARHLFELSAINLRSKNDFHLFAGANLLQDAVEVFLIAVAYHINAPIDENTKFPEFFKKINERIQPAILPFQHRIIAMNKMRVNAKHYGTQPDRSECERFAVTVREFLDEVSHAHLGINFWTVSGIDLLEDSEAKTILLEATAAFERHELKACMINCRKAVYLKIEQSYDVSKFQDGSKPTLFDFCSAPAYAKTKSYIDQSVHAPTDFIVLDHSHIEHELLKYRVDINAFWNIWRLTPSVYRSSDGQWTVKEEFEKLTSDSLEANTEYVLSATIEILLAIQTARAAIRTKEYQPFFITLKKECVPVFEKASTNSKIIGQTPPGLEQINCDYRIAGLSESGPFWHVFHAMPGAFFFGFVNNDDVQESGTQ